MDYLSRIKLKKGKQKELIEEAKSRNGFSWRILSKCIGLSTDYLKNEMRNEMRTLRADVYYKLCELAGKNYDEHIDKILGENWGRAKGGKNSISKPRKPELLISEPNENLAEFVGIMLGDGNLHEYQKNSIYQVRVFGHKNDDYEYIVDKVYSLFESLFNIEPSIYFKDGKKVIILSKQSKNLNYTLKFFGLRPGNKIDNGSSIPEWIFDNKNYLKACIRGLVDTDGSIYPKTRKHKTPTIWFSNASPGIRRDFNKALKRLGYRLSKWTSKKNRRCQCCSIGSSKEVWRYYQEIGFSNPKHQQRFKEFWTAPIV